MSCDNGYARNVFIFQRCSQKYLGGECYLGLALILPQERGSKNVKILNDEYMGVHCSTLLTFKDADILIRKFKKKKKKAPGREKCYRHNSQREAEKCEMQTNNSDSLGQRPEDLGDPKCQPAIVTNSHNYDYRCQEDIQLFFQYTGIQ